MSCILAKPMRLRKTLDYMYTCKPLRSILKGLAFTGFLGIPFAGLPNNFLGNEKNTKNLGPEQHEF